MRKWAKAKRTRREPGKMNSTESKYATDVLNVGVAMGVYAS